MSDATPPLPGDSRGEDEAPLPVVESSFLSALSLSHGTDASPTVQLQGDAVESVASSRVEHLRADGDANQQRYVLDKEIGRGGMGAVLKIFDVDLRRHLAMKVALGQGGESDGEASELDPGRLMRFLEEAQVTGQLDHPGVVPVHELGVDADGRVYFTMRLVKGQDLSTVFDRVHAGDPDWNVTRALGALLKVCEAMSYAHEKGVVHRDLKPANVMVGRHGQVYVMDWGLARVEGCEDSHEVQLKSLTDLSLSVMQTDRRDAARKAQDSPIGTLDGSVLGTPYYMPPEQAAGRLAEIGPHSDVYALGAMLYHLLTGRMPYHTPGDRLSPHTILAMVLQGPPKPVHELAPRVPPALEAICEKAMAREVGERYADMGELREDLRAFLENRVVRSYRTGAFVELKKWVQRNRALAAAVAALAFLTVGGSSTAAVVFGAKNREILAARDEALLAQAASERVTNFLVSQFEALEPGATPGRPASVGDLLDLAARSLDDEVGSSTAESAQLRAVVGDAYLSLGLYDPAEPLLKQALAIRRELLGEDHRDTLASLDRLAVLYERQGRYEEAAPLQRQALEARRAALGEDDADTLTSLANLGYLCESMELLEEAEELYTEAYEKRREILGPKHRDTLVSQDMLGFFYEYLKRYEESESLMVPAYEGFREVLGEEHPLTLITMSHLAMLRGNQGELDEAEQLYTRMLEQGHAILGEDHPDVLDTQNNLALLYDRQGRYEDAEPLYVHVIARSRETIGADHPDTLITLTHLVKLYANLDRYEEAEPLARELLGYTDPGSDDHAERGELLRGILEAR